MNLGLDARLGEGYPSASQWARRVTEGWAAANLYCPACASASLAAHVNNRAVEDYHCPECTRQVQVKAKQGHVGSTISNSAYGKKKAAILANRAPDYCFLGYDRDALLVNEVLWVPGHFITLSVISARKPLGESARRRGWIGSNIHLDRIPGHGKIPLVAGGAIRRPTDVRKQFQETLFLRGLPAELRGWIADVWTCIDDLGVHSGQAFATADVYAFDKRLAKLHPDNHNIEAKIRQKLQVLVANGRLERVQRGIYRRK